MEASINSFQYLHKKVTSDMKHGSLGSSFVDHNADEEAKQDPCKFVRSRLW